MVFWNVARDDPAPTSTASLLRTELNASMKSLNKSTKILVAGIAIAGAVLVVGVLNTIRLERLTNELESACNAWAAKQQAPTVIDSASPVLRQKKLKALAQSRLQIEREYGKLSDAKIIARAKKEGVNPAEWPELFDVRDDIEQRAMPTHKPGTNTWRLEQFRALKAALDSPAAPQEPIGHLTPLEELGLKPTQDSAAPELGEGIPAEEFERSSYTPQENAEEFAEAMNCDSDAIAKNWQVTSIQAAIQRALVDHNASKNWPNSAAAILLGLGAIP